MYARRTLRSNITLMTLLHHYYVSTQSWRRSVQISAHEDILYRCPTQREKQIKVSNSISNILKRLQINGYLCLNPCSRYTILLLLLLLLLLLNNYVIEESRAQWESCYSYVFIT